MSPGESRCVFITGATKGIGKATAELFYSRGFLVGAAGRSLDSISPLADDRFLPVHCDVADRESVTSAVQAVRDAFGPIEIVVNNAGFGIPAPVDAIATEELADLFDVNVLGAHRVVRETVGDMKRLRRGRIVNVSSAAGRIVTPSLGAYCASKFALEALSDAMRMELRPYGIRVSIIEPGPIDTSFNERAQAELDKVTERLSHEDPDRAGEVSRYVKGGRNLLGRFRKDAESVARAIYAAATAPNPKARYRITLPAWAAEFGRILPAAATDIAMAGIRGRISSND
jgi:NAD(P)-dependent dehydrogenase (short-subunit alcohol dehydrogenase family)